MFLVILGFLVLEILVFQVSLYFQALLEFEGLVASLVVLPVSQVTLVVDCRLREHSLQRLTELMVSNTDFQSVLKVELVCFPSSLEVHFLERLVQGLLELVGPLLSVCLQQVDSPTLCKEVALERVVHHRNWFLPHIDNCRFPLCTASQREDQLVALDNSCF